LCSRPVVPYLPVAGERGPGRTPWRRGPFLPPWRQEVRYCTFKLEPRPGLSLGGTCGHLVQLDGRLCYWHEKVRNGAPVAEVSDGADWTPAGEHPQSGGRQPVAALVFLASALGLWMMGLIAPRSEERKRGPNRSVSSD